MSFSTLRGKLRPNVIPVVITVVAIFLLWEAGAYILYHTNDPLARSKLPPPHDIATTMYSLRQTLLTSMLSTLRIAAIGLVAGTVIGAIIAVLMSASRWMEAAIFPYILAARMVPAIVLGPIVVAVFSSVQIGGIVLSAYISFFIVALLSLLGLRSAPQAELELMASLNASRTQVYRLVRLPTALPFFLTSLKIAGPLSVVGAIVVELMGSNRGLGYLLISANYYGVGSGYLLWASVMVTLALGLILSQIPVAMERYLTPWQAAFRASDLGEMTIA